MNYRETLITKLNVKIKEINYQLNDNQGTSMMEKYGLIERKRQIEEDIRLVEDTIPWRKES